MRADWVLTNDSSGCGIFTWAGARALFASGISMLLNCCLQRMERRADCWAIRRLPTPRWRPGRCRHEREAPIGLISLSETKRRTPNATQQVGCSALVFLNLRGDLQFHQCVARKSRDADRGTNVSPSVAEDLHEQSGCAVDDRRLCWNPATAFNWPFTPK